MIVNCIESPWSTSSSPLLRQLQIVVSGGGSRGLGGGIVKAVLRIAKSTEKVFTLFKLSLVWCKSVWGGVKRLSARGNYFNACCLLILSLHLATKLSKYPAAVAEWSKTLLQIQVAISSLKTQVQIPLRTI